MLKHKIGLGGIILMGASACLSGSVFAAPLQILDFKTEQLNQTTQDQLCTQLKNLCKKGVQWRSLTTPDQNLWVLSNRNDVAQFKPTSMGYKLIRQWNIVTVAAKTLIKNNMYFPNFFH